MRKLLAFLLLLASGVAIWLFWALWLPLSPPGGRTLLMLRPGYSSRRVARALKSAGVIRDAHAFELWHELKRHSSLKAGEYLFVHSASAVDIHRRLVRGD